MPLPIPHSSVVKDILALSPKKLSAGIEVVGPWASGKPLVAMQLAEQRGSSLLYITAGRMESEDALEDITTFAESHMCIHMPAWEVLPTDTMDPTDNY